MNFFLLPDDLIRYIYDFDNTYHCAFTKVKEQLLHKTKLLLIVLEARYSNHKINNGTIIYEYKDRVLYNKKVKNGNIWKLHWRYHLMDKI